MPKDTLYKDPRSKVAPFAFNAEVTAVFDDMLTRSIPGYTELIRRQAQLCRHFLQPETHLYDLGCSHGNLGLQVLAEALPLAYSIRGVDNAPAMLTRYRQRLTGHPQAERVALICADLMDVEIRNASVVAINFTLHKKPSTYSPPPPDGHAALGGEVPGWHAFCTIGERTSS